MRILIAYATKEGQTRKVVECLAERLRQDATLVTEADVEGLSPDPTEYDAAIVAASVHVSRYAPTMERYVSAHSEALSRMHSAFVSVSLAAASPNSAEELDGWVEEFLGKTGWPAEQVVHVAGALRYREYDFVTRWIMRSIARKNGLATDTSNDYEYTDWDALRRFADSFVAGSIAPARRPRNSASG